MRTLLYTPLLRRKLPQLTQQMLAAAARIAHNTKSHSNTTQPLKVELKASFGDARWLCAFVLPALLAAAWLITKYWANIESVVWACYRYYVAAAVAVSVAAVAVDVVVAVGVGDAARRGADVDVDAAAFKSAGYLVLCGSIGLPSSVICWTYAVAVQQAANGTGCWMLNVLSRKRITQQVQWRN